MRLKHFGWLFFAISLLIWDRSSLSQVVPQAQVGSGQTFSIGVGPANYDVDWGHGRMFGGTIWADWYPSQVPRSLHGLGIEAEARDISLNRSSTQPSNLREDTIGGGPIYSWPHFRNFRPYGKALVEFGSMDFQIHRLPSYTHDSRALFAPGLGFDYRVFRSIWARADYEYQIWGTLFAHTPDPQGFTVGVAYAFGSRMGR